MGKGWNGFDLDGTLAEYTEWQGIEHIGKPTKSDVWARLRQHLANGEECRIFTARVCRAQGAENVVKAVKIITEWCIKYIGQELPITAEKDYDIIRFYDDRAIQVELNTGRILPTQNTK